MSTPDPIELQNRIDAENHSALVVILGQMLCYAGTLPGINPVVSLESRIISGSMFYRVIVEFELNGNSHRLASPIEQLCNLENRRYWFNLENVLSEITYQIGDILFRKKE